MELNSIEELWESVRNTHFRVNPQEDKKAGVFIYYLSQSVLTAVLRVVNSLALPPTLAARKSPQEAEN